MFKLKDNAFRSINIGEYHIVACDVDDEGYIENIDIVKNGEVLRCVNAQSNDALILLFALLLRCPDELIETVHNLGH